MLTHVPYLVDGWIDWGSMLPQLFTYTWMWGGRGIGKTYGCLEQFRLDHPKKFMLMRRTQPQIDMLWKPIFNPFADLDRQRDVHTCIVKDGSVGIFYDGYVDPESNEVKPQGKPLGIAVAMSVMHNLRGIDMSDIDVVIYDEFIPEAHARNTIKNEYEALLNVLETIGRNRELQGRPPLQFIGLTNSNQLGNAYFLGLGVIRVVQKMIDKKTEVWTDPDRGLMLIQVTHSPISEKKKGTALYKLAGQGAFSDMSLGNEYTEDVCSHQGSFPLQEVVPQCAVGEICIYRHKSKPLWYVTSHISGSPGRYGADDTSLRRFKKEWWMLWVDYLSYRVVFQDILCEILFKKYFA